MSYPKVVDSPHYHVWSDALHARALATQANNEWDRGTYVRWTVISAWTVLEMVSEYALSTTGLGRSFRKNVDRAIVAAGKPPLNWGSGAWQEVLSLRDARVGYVHLNSGQDALFPNVQAANEAIGLVRRAIEALCAHLGQAAPSWIADDEDPGWVGRGRLQGHAHVLAIRAGVDPDAPETIRLAYIHKGVEHVAEYHRPDEDIEEAVADLLRRMRIPISAIRIYQGPNLQEDRPLRMRGAS